MHHIFRGNVKGDGLRLILSTIFLALDREKCADTLRLVIVFFLCDDHYLPNEVSGLVFTKCLSGRFIIPLETLMQRAFGLRASSTTAAFVGIRFYGRESAQASPLQSAQDMEWWTAPDFSIDRSALGSFTLFNRLGLLERNSRINMKGSPIHADFFRIGPSLANAAMQPGKVKQVYHLFRRQILALYLTRIFAAQVRNSPRKRISAVPMPTLTISSRM